MQCFIGGACSGRRRLVDERFPEALWHRLAPGEDVAAWLGDLASGGSLVVTGWAGWLTALLAETPDDEAARAIWQRQLAALVAAEQASGGEALLILDEMGRGIVPMAPEARRLRDQAGWLTQEAAARSAAVWYVRHGLIQRLDVPVAPGQGDGTSH